MSQPQLVRDQAVLRDLIGRVEESARARDGFILRRISDGKIGFIVPAHKIPSLGLAHNQYWVMEVIQSGDRYFKARLIQRVNIVDGAALNVAREVIESAE